MGCFYTGFDYKNRKNGYFKIGETEKNTPAARLSQIRQKDAFMCLGYIQVSGDKPERLFIESYVRLKMSKKFEHIQNDHFVYKIEKGRKYEQAFEIAEKALKYAIEACEMINVKWSFGEKTFKRG